MLLVLRAHSEILVNRTNKYRCVGTNQPQGKAFLPSVLVGDGDTERIACMRLCTGDYAPHRVE